MAELVIGVPGQESQVVLPSSQIALAGKVWRAEQQIGFAGLVAAVVRPVGEEGAQEDVGEAVAVAVAGGQGGAQAVVGAGADDREGRLGLGKVQGRRQCGLAKDDVGLARVGPLVVRPIGQQSAQHDIGEAVAVDVAGGHGEAQEVAAAGPEDDDVRAVATQVQRPAMLRAEEDVGFAGVGPAVVGTVGRRGADDEVALAVAVHVAAGDGAQPVVRTSSQDREGGLLMGEIDDGGTAASAATSRRQEHEGGQDDQRCSHQPEGAAGCQ